MAHLPPNRRRQRCVGGRCTAMSAAFGTLAADAFVDAAAAVAVAVLVTPPRRPHALSSARRYVGTWAIVAHGRTLGTKSEAICVSALSR